MGSTICPACDTPRIGAFRFCRSCQFDFDSPPPPANLPPGPAMAPPTVAQLPPPGSAPPTSATETSYSPVAEPKGKAAGGRTVIWAKGAAAILVAVAVLLGAAVLGGLIQTGGAP